MRKLMLLAVACAAVLSAQFTPDASTRLSFQVLAFSRGGERRIEARSVYLDTFGKNGQPIKRQLFVEFDPVTGYFLFAYEGLGQVDAQSEESKFFIPSDEQRTTFRPSTYISQAGITTVSVGYPALVIWQSTQKSRSAEDAERQALAQLAANAVEAARQIEWPQPKRAALLGPDGKGLLDSSFHIPPNSAFAGRVSVVGISESREGWEVTLQGQYKARITLSPAFQPLKAERIESRLP